MNILVTGGAGYLGSVLVPKLLVRGHRVHVMDLGYFGMGHLRGMRPEVTLLREDLRRVIEDAGFAASLLENVDCVMHLAAMSNDPSAELRPELTEETNYRGTVALARAAKAAGVRFLFSSSCSVYGDADGVLDEDGPVNPLTTYAVSKLKAEQELEQMADAQWRPVILRNGTLFGYSPRMRFDLVINIFSLYATLYNEIRVFGEGKQWRPFLHISDCARAFIFLAEKRNLKHHRYNVCRENLRVTDLAQIFSELKPGLKVSYTPTEDADVRDYAVSGARLREEGYEPRIEVRVGAEEIMDAIVSGLVPDPESVFYRNAKWLRELTNIGSLDHRHIVGLLESFQSVHSSRRH
ncbi:MAG: NAD-dependent epimerase/dehydratase family protein [Bryobacteraceae bacterium]